MKYGRVDASGPEDCPEEGRLPGKVSLFTVFVDVRWLLRFIKVLLNYRYHMFVL